MWEVQQPHLLPIESPANSRGTDPYRQTARGNEVTPACLSPPGSSPAGAWQAGVGLPKKRRPRGKPGDKDEADVGTACCGIEVTSKGAAKTTR